MSIGNIGNLPIFIFNLFEIAETTSAGISITMEPIKKFLHYFKFFASAFSLQADIPCDVE